MIRQLEPQTFDATAVRLGLLRDPVTWSWVAVRRPPNIDLFGMSVRSDTDFAEVTHDYGRLVMVRELLAPNEAAARIRAKQAGTALMGDSANPVAIASTIANVAGVLLPSNEEWGAVDALNWPTFYLEWPLTPTDELVTAAQLSLPVTRPGQPPRDNAESAVYEFLYGRALELPALRRLSPSVIFSLADKRGRLGEPRVADGLITVRCDLGDFATDRPFTLQATWMDDAGARERNELPVSASGTFELGAAASELVEYYVVLLDADGEWCDERRYRKSPFVDALSSAQRVAATNPFRRYGATASPVSSPASEGGSMRRHVFIVHGHDHELLNAVELWVRRAVSECDPVVLKDQPHQGRTLVEKLEQSLGNDDYVVVLMSADDHGSERMPLDTPEFREQAALRLQPRARQNVVLELGFAFGRLGRKHVAVIYDENVERPSDIDGICYISAGDWRPGLARELHALGFDIAPGF